VPEAQGLLARFHRARSHSFTHPRRSRKVKKKRNPRGVTFYLRVGINKRRHDSTPLGKRFKKNAEEDLGWL